MDPIVHKITYNSLFHSFLGVQAYKEINTFVALTGFEVWTDSDKITVSPVAGATLDSFTQWRNSDLVKRQQHDNAHLLRSVYMGKINTI